jgi:hypothetical protein
MQHVINRLFYMQFVYNFLEDSIYQVRAEKFTGKPDTFSQQPETRNPNIEKLCKEEFSKESLHPLLRLFAVKRGFSY